ncbi:hypothetical protein Taro_025466 [Colocasia esculenta]|uniref:Uncharacterized protein n=1 Tax=Colocasia esculenta TaxID=4460 RepID=A0A843VGL8_COLES|nr:hypothetical protein [Colocasia esculenta]
MVFVFESTAGCLCLRQTKCLYTLVRHKQCTGWPDVACGTDGGFTECRVFCLTPASTLGFSDFPRHHCKTEKRFEIGIVGIYLSCGMTGWLPSSHTCRLPTMMDLPDLEMAAYGLLLS